MLSSVPVLAAFIGSALAFSFPGLPEGKTFRASVGRVAGGPPLDILNQIESNLKTRGNGRGGIINKSYWFANVTAGSTQNVTLLLDTGSAVTWTLSPNTSAQQNAGQLIYDPTKSKTATRIAGETYDIAYGDGSVEVNGTVWNETLCVGTACSAAPIGPASYMVGFTPGSVKSGIMGLSFGVASQYAPKKLPTFMEAIQRSLSLPIFTTNFRFDGTGYIDFGMVNTALYTGALQNVAIDNSTGSWNANNVGFYAGGKQLGTNLTMNFDTGAPNTYVSNATITAYHAQVKNATYYNGRWQFPCSQQSALPDLQFRFANGAVGKIPGPQMLWTPLDTAYINCTTWMVPTTGDGSFGDAWFNANVMVFNQSVPAVAFALKNS